MNTDPQKSATFCGCDEGANHLCERHAKFTSRDWYNEIKGTNTASVQAFEAQKIGSAQWRKERPLYSGCIAYFPDALQEVAHVSFLGNKQHHEDKPLHWDRTKSMDQLDADARHLADHSKSPRDTDGALHLAKHAWRALAELQLFLEKERA